MSGRGKRRKRIEGVRKKGERKGEKRNGETERQ